MLKNLLVFLFGLISSIGFGEVFIRVTNADVAIIMQHAYTMGDGVQLKDNASLFEPLHEPGRNYQNVANTRVICTNCTHPKERKYREAEFTTNSFRIRGSERKIHKSPDTYRIVIFGNSNTFGYSVSDEDSYPAKLEVSLNKDGNQKFEVWNAGVIAYSNMQIMRYVKSTISKWKPDLVIIQDSGIGRRPFYIKDTNPAQHFTLDFTLFEENLPLLFLGIENASALHYKFLRSALYRFFVASLNQIALQPHLNYCKDSSSSWDCLYERITRKYYFKLAENRAVREFEQIIANHQNVNFLLLHTVTRRNCRSPVRKFRFHWDASLCELPKDPEYRFNHPPAYVYDVYVERLLGILKDIGVR